MKRHPIRAIIIIILMCGMLHTFLVAVAMALSGMPMGPEANTIGLVSSLSLVAGDWLIARVQGSYSQPGLHLGMVAAECAVWTVFQLAVR